MKEKVIKKLTSLMFGEAFALFMFAVLWVWYSRYFNWRTPYLTSLPTVFTFIILEFLLVQGSLYWYLKWRMLKKGQKENKLTSLQLFLFEKLKVINILLLLTGAGFYVFDGRGYPASYHWFFILLYGFTLLEYINYYYIRLSYQSPEEIKEFIRQKGFRKSILAREISGYKAERRVRRSGKDYFL
ncbi:hypothetical protein ACOJQI_19680 [Bacillus salacetis]|uniref:hypothetical protein n=1 Tax=Bacillus salacetis TaxID=2315464 RepID=UPI003B9F7CA1